MDSWPDMPWKIHNSPAYGPVQNIPHDVLEKQKNVILQLNTQIIVSAQRVSKLESLVSELKSRIKELEEEVRQLRPKPTSKPTNVTNVPPESEIRNIDLGD